MIRIKLTRLSAVRFRVELVIGHLLVLSREVVLMESDRTVTIEVSDE